MCSLDEELAHEPDQRELDICKAESLVELLDDLEHVDEGTSQGDSSAPGVLRCDADRSLSRPRHSKVMS